MTSPTGPDLPPDLAPHQVVELASASVDGVLTPAEVTHAAGFPQVSALADEFAKLRNHLGTTAEVNPDTREAHLAAALEAFTTTGAPIHSLETARARRARRLAPVLAAAAAIAAIGLVAGSIASRGPDSPSVSADGASAEMAPADSATLARAAATEAVDASVPESVLVASTDEPIAPQATKEGGTGEIIDAAPLAGDTPSQIPALVASALEARAAAAIAPPDTACPSLRGEPIAPVIWRGVNALLVVAPSATAPSDAFVIDVATCDVIASATLGS